MNENWREQAVCRKLCRAGLAHPDWWFPTRGQTAKTSPEVAAALDACSRCPVTAECLHEGLTLGRMLSGEAMGIWGGVLSRGRRALKRILPVPNRTCKACGHTILIHTKQPGVIQCGKCYTNQRL